MTKLFLDTAPFIYLVENHPAFYQSTATYVAQAVASGTVLITSVVTYMEFCVKPAQLNRPDVILDFENLLRELNVELLDIALPIAVRAYQLRAGYPALKGMDALQLGTALHAGCDVFLTNDQRLKTVAELSIITVADL